jgi:hypothetical protein
MEDSMGKKAEDETRTNPEGTLKVAKKPYASPQLIEYGNVEKLTQSGNTSGADNMSMMGCL